MVKLRIDRCNSATNDARGVDASFWPELFPTFHTHTEYRDVTMRVEYAAAMRGVGM